MQQAFSRAQITRQQKLATKKLNLDQPGIEAGQNYGYD
jgi:hypothetical protein